MMKALYQKIIILLKINISDLNRRDKLFKNENTGDKEKRVLNIRPKCGVSPAYN